MIEKEYLGYDLLIVWFQYDTVDHVQILTIDTL